MGLHCLPMQYLLVPCQPWLHSDCLHLIRLSITHIMRMLHCGSFFSSSCTGLTYYPFLVSGLMKCIQFTAVSLQLRFMESSPSCWWLMWWWKNHGARKGIAKDALLLKFGTKKIQQIKRIHNFVNYSRRLYQSIFSWSFQTMFIKYSNFCNNTTIMNFFIY